MVLIATNQTIFTTADDWNKIFEFIGYICAACIACRSMTYMITRVTLEDPLLYAFKEKAQKAMHVLIRSFFIIAVSSVLTLMINILFVLVFCFFRLIKV